jgi:hypothetical protein
MVDIWLYPHPIIEHFKTPKRKKGKILSSNLDHHTGSNPLSQTIDLMIFESDTPVCPVGDTMNINASASRSMNPNLASESRILWRSDPQLMCPDDSFVLTP